MIWLPHSGWYAQVPSICLQISWSLVFNSWVIPHSINVPHFLYAFYCWGTIGLFPASTYYEYVFYECVGACATQILKWLNSLSGPESQCLYMFSQEQNNFKAMSCWKNLSHWVWAIKFSASWKAVSARTLQMKMYNSQFCLHHACLDGVMLSCLDDTWQNLYTCNSAPIKCLS
jgi:hypothetical protein